MAEDCLIRLGGGLYASNAIEFCDSSFNTILKVGRDSDGIRSLSMRLENAEGDLVVDVKDSLFGISEENAHDIEFAASGHRLKVWLEAGKVGVDLAFYRQAIDEIEGTIRKHEATYCESVGFSPSDWKKLEESGDESPQVRSHSPGSIAIRRAALMVRDSDGKVPIIDLVNADIRARGTRLLMRNGLLWGGAGQFATTYVQSPLPIVVPSSSEVEHARLIQRNMKEARAHLSRLHRVYQTREKTRGEVSDTIIAGLREFGIPKDRVAILIDSLDDSTGQLYHQLLSDMLR